MSETEMVTEEYKDRTAEIYFNSVERKNKFYQIAKDKGSTFSKFVVNLLESATAPDDIDISNAEDIMLIAKMFLILGQKQKG